MIPIDSVLQQVRMQHLLTPPEGITLTSLEKDLIDTLYKYNLPRDIKLQMYNDILQKMIQTKNKLKPSPGENPILEQNIKSPPTTFLTTSAHDESQNKEDFANDRGENSSSSANDFVNGQNGIATSTPVVKRSPKSSSTTASSVKQDQKSLPGPLLKTELGTSVSSSTTNDQDNIVSFNKTPPLHQTALSRSEHSQSTNTDSGSSSSGSKTSTDKSKTYSDLTKNELKKLIKSHADTFIKNQQVLKDKILLYSTHQTRNIGYNPDNIHGAFRDMYGSTKEKDSKNISFHGLNDKKKTLYKHVSKWLTEKLPPEELSSWNGWVKYNRNISSTQQTRTRTAQAKRRQRSPSSLDDKTGGSGKISSQKRKSILHIDFDSWNKLLKYG